MRIKEVKRIAVLISGTGTTLLEILKAIARGYIPAEVALVIADDPLAKGLKHADKYDVTQFSSDRSDFKREEFWRETILPMLRRHNIDMICCAGFLQRVPQCIIDEFPDLIINSHPARLPMEGGGNEFGGKYGSAVTLAVLKARCTETGSTIHLIRDEGYDTGPGIMRNSIVVTPYELAFPTQEMADALLARQLPEERYMVVEVIKAFAEGRIDVEKNTVTILSRAA